ncbi:MAG: Cys-tRNA(Pro) deacylase [Melioribacteraceae bacterium]|jgi:Cys-tRNA(Pro)/Cys-tRNA(Cys) deacylase|nr:Cys-tRNA(Pro) deacylase [Melioribacteraceae bacterium]
MKKTNAIRILEANKINFQLFHYEFSLEEIDAVSVALKIGAESESVFKTLIARSNTNELFAFVIPGNEFLNLKKAANVSGSKKIEMIKEKELLPLTGYIKGGCTSIGLKKQYPVFIDETAQLFEEIYISAGVRGTQMKLNPNELKELVNAEFVDLV